MPETTAGISLLENPLIRRLIQLDLERDNFVIFGSGPLLAHGIRKNIRDLDVVARGSAWHRVCDQGIPSAGKISNAPATCFWGGRIQFFREWISTDWDSDDLIDQAEIIEGLRFARLADVLAYKRILMRPKDIMDIHAMSRSKIDTLRRSVLTLSPGLWQIPVSAGKCPIEGDLTTVVRPGWATPIPSAARQHGCAEMSPTGDHVAEAVVWSVGHAVAEPTVAQRPSWSP